MDSLSTASFIRLEGNDAEVEPKFDQEISKQLDTLDKLGKYKGEDIYFNPSNATLGVICGFKVGLDFH
jgi:hypothetical protein